MSQFQKLLVALLISAVPPLCHADGLIFKLPADGTSATFRIKITDDAKEISGTLKISSVGVVEEELVKKRWIEFKTKMNVSEQDEQVIRAKLLIPEIHLGKGKAGFANFIKGLQSVNGGPVEAIDPKNPPRRLGPPPIFLSGPLDDQKELEPVEVDSLLGRRECPGVAGTMKLKDGPMDVIIKMETRLHEDAPFGVVQSKIEFKVLDGEKKEIDGGIISLVLDRAEEGSKSELPDDVPTEE